MRILAIEHEQPLPVRPDLPDLLRAEAAAVWTMQQSGVIRDIWLTRADRRVIMLLECASATEARQQIDRLPLVRSRVIDFTLHGLTSYDGFEHLFARPAETVPATEYEPPEY